jgi:tryptophan-rich sensory protein
LPSHVKWLVRVEMSSLPAWVPHVLVPVGITVVINSIIFSTGMYRRGNSPLDKASKPWLPPGPIIGLVWIVLLGLLGYLHYLVYSLQKRFSVGCYALWGLFVYSVAYPWLSGLRVEAGLVLNLGALVLAGATAFVIAVYERVHLVWWLVPYLLWALYVNFVFCVACASKS